MNKRRDKGRAEDIEIKRNQKRRKMAKTKSTTVY